MGKKYNNLISTTAGFNYAAQQPLDDREVVQSYSDLAELVSSNISYEGMEVYVVDDKKSYKLIDAEWKPIATEQYVDKAIADMVDSAPETLNTLNELAVALGNDPNFATTVANQIGKKVDKVDGKQLSTEDYTTEDKQKLASIDGQIASQITELSNKKVDKIDGKGLSSNDYTTEDKTKLTDIEDGAQVNVQSDWNQSDKTKADFIKNKPTIYTQEEVNCILKEEFKENFPENTGSSSKIHVATPKGRKDANGNKLVGIKLSSDNANIKYRDLLAKGYIDGKELYTDENGIHWWVASTYLKRLSGASNIDPPEKAGSSGGKIGVITLQNRDAKKAELAAQGITMLDSAYNNAEDNGEPTIETIVCRDGMGRITIEDGVYAFHGVNRRQLDALETRIMESIDALETRIMESIDEVEDELRMINEGGIE